MSSPHACEDGGEMPATAYTPVDKDDTLMLSPLPRLRRNGVRMALATAAGFAGVKGFMVARAGFGEAAAPARASVQAAIEKVDWWGAPPCGITEQDLEYRAKGGAFGEYPGVGSLDECRAKCVSVAECQVWTYFQDARCQLSQTDQGEVVTKSPNPGAISGGMPCHLEQTSPPFSLFCWALIQPNSYEQMLLADQYKKHLSIFNCEEYSVLSSMYLEIVPGLLTEVVNVDMKCEKGGEFGTALNTDIFLKIWNKIVESGKYRMHDYTVKCDPDAVFFVDRLRALLPHHPEESKGVYLNNCKMGMHGPIEVFSRNAVDALDRNWQACTEHFKQVCQGDCKWGEDMFIDQCLQKVAGVRRDNEWKLLAEDHCLMDPGAAWGPDRCDGIHVAFHPFKEQSSYSQCYSNAWAQSPVS